MKIKVKKQPNSSACGPTVIQLVTQYFKKPVSFVEISKLTSFKRTEGLSNDEIVQSAEEKKRVLGEAHGDSIVFQFQGENLNRTPSTPTSGIVVEYGT